jgi:hypothetical protein
MADAHKKPNYEELVEENARLREDLTNVLVQLRELKRHVFGRKSERLNVVSDSQSSLFDTELPELDEPEP